MTYDQVSGTLPIPGQQIFAKVFVSVLFASLNICSQFFFIVNKLLMIGIRYLVIIFHTMFKFMTQLCYNFSSDLVNKGISLYFGKDLIV